MLVLSCLASNVPTLSALGSGVNRAPSAVLASRFHSGSRGARPVGCRDDAGSSPGSRVAGPALLRPWPTMRFAQRCAGFACFFAICFQFREEFGYKTASKGRGMNNSFPRGLPFEFFPVSCCSFVPINLFRFHISLTTLLVALVCRGSRECCPVHLQRRFQECQSFRVESAKAGKLHL